MAISMFATRGNGSAFIERGYHFENQSGCPVIDFTDYRGVKDIARDLYNNRDARGLTPGDTYTIWAKVAEVTIPYPDPPPSSIRRLEVAD